MEQETFGGYPYPKYSLTKEEESALDFIHNKFGLMEDFKVEFGSDVSKMMRQLKSKYYASTLQDGPKYEIWYIHKRDENEMQFDAIRNNLKTQLDDDLNPRKSRSKQNHIW